MTRLHDLEYLKLNRAGRFSYRLRLFISSLPARASALVRAVARGFVYIGRWVRSETLDIANTFAHGSYKTKMSYFIMGFGNIARGQITRGLLFLVFQAVYIAYMSVSGFHWLSKLSTLGDIPSHEEYSEILDTYVRVGGDDSFKILLYGLLTLFFTVAFVWTWRQNVKQNRVSEEILASGKKLKSGRDDIHSLIDDKFHKTLLALPLTGILLFTVMPIVFMILVAFTNYDGAHDGYSNLFTWVGLANFNELISSGSSNTNLPYTFGEILSWTLIWAVFATFTNYFLGMLVAIVINKRTVRLKKLWRGILILTIAIPQFVSLLYVSKLFANNGLVNSMLMNFGLVNQPVQFWRDPMLARMTVIGVNIWIGIPYLMLIATGILMNIPSDLYESARIDGANVFQQYRRITLPYMLFVTGPYLLTSFIANINNFNVIYLLTWGQAVDNPALTTSGGNATDVDLLITWLFKITTGATSNYKLAAVIGIMIFIVVSVISLIVYNLIPSTRNEEDYS